MSKESLTAEEGHRDLRNRSSKVVLYGEMLFSDEPSPGQELRSVPNNLPDKYNYQFGRGQVQAFEALWESISEVFENRVSAEMIQERWGRVRAVMEKEYDQLPELDQNVFPFGPPPPPPPN